MKEFIKELQTWIKETGYVFDDYLGQEHDVVGRLALEEKIKELEKEYEQRLLNS